MLRQIEQCGVGTGKNPGGVQMGDSHLSQPGQIGLRPPGGVVGEERTSNPAVMAELPEVQRAGEQGVPQIKGAVHVKKKLLYSRQLKGHTILLLCSAPPFSHDARPYCSARAQSLRRRWLRADLLMGGSNSAASSLRDSSG